MNDPRPWIIRKLSESAVLESELHKPGFESIGAHGLRVLRKGRPHAMVYCAGVDGEGAFGVKDLDHALDELPETQFVVVVPRQIDNAVYARAEEIGLCVEGFGELTAALQDDDNVSHHLPREHAYVARRLRARKMVRSVRRCGFSTYEIKRTNLPDLMVITSDEYELTADDVYSLLETCDFDVNAVAATNPNVRGLSRDALRAGQMASVRVLQQPGFGGVCSMCPQVVAGGTPMSHNRDDVHRGA